MPRPDPALLDPARYRFCVTMQTRYADLDTNRHVNNVALAGLLEDARVRFYDAAGYLKASEGLATMVVSLSIDFLGQAFYPGDIQVHAAVLALGGRSYQIGQLMRQDGRTIAFARSTCVCVEGEHAVALPEAFRTSAEAFRLAD